MALQGVPSGRAGFCGEPCPGGVPALGSWFWGTPSPKAAPVQQILPRGVHLLSKAQGVWLQPPPRGAGANGCPISQGCCLPSWPQA